MAGVIVGKKPDALRDNRFRHQPYARRVFAYESALENPARPLRQIAALKIRQQRCLDLGRRGDRFEHNSAAFSL
jgi:hypothetical protein